MDFNRIKYHFDKAGVKPEVVLDIGACEGQWCREFKKLYPDCLVHQFEANKDMSSKLEGTYDIVLLGDTHLETVNYYKGGNQTGNSIFVENSIYYKDCEIEHLPMYTLDQVLAGRYEHINLLKADIQGNEINLLKGSLETLSKVDLILLEVSFVSYNRGAPLATEVFAYLDSIDYQPIDILEKHYYRDIFIQSDILFARKNSKYITTYFD